MLKYIMIVILLFTAEQSFSEESTDKYAATNSMIIGGSVPPSLQIELVEDLWIFLTSISDPPEGTKKPILMLMTFDRNKADPKWVEMQMAWAKKIGRNKYFWDEGPKRFLGFYYLGTRFIQVDPVIFLHTGKQKNFVDRPLVSKGEYAIAHEMLHYILAKKGVPIYLHHCTMAVEYTESVIFYLQEKWGLDESLSKKIFMGEITTCVENFPMLPDLIDLILRNDVLFK